MSFDTTFIYTDLIAALTAKLNMYQTRLDDTNTAITNTNAITGFADVKAAELARLTMCQTRCTEYINGYNDALDEIDDVMALGASDKANLYGFYAHQPLGLEQYMCTIAHSHPAMIVDADLIALVLNAAGNTVDEQLIVGTYIATRYGQSMYCA